MDKMKITKGGKQPLKRILLDDTSDDSLNSEIINRNKKLLIWKKRNKQNRAVHSSSSEGSPDFGTHLNYRLKEHLLKYYAEETFDEVSLLNPDVEQLPEIISNCTFKPQVRDNIKQKEQNGQFMEVISTIPTAWYTYDPNDSMNVNNNIDHQQKTIDTGLDSDHHYHNPHQQESTNLNNSFSKTPISSIVPKSQKSSHVMKVLSEFYRQQNMGNLVIPRLPFLRIVRDIMRTYPNMGIQSSAVAALHESSEAMIIDFFEDVNKYASHRDRKTAGVRDVKLAFEIRQKYDKSFF